MYMCCWIMINTFNVSVSLLALILYKIFFLYLTSLVTYLEAPNSKYYIYNILVCQQNSITSLHILSLTIINICLTNVFLLSYVTQVFPTWQLSTGHTLQWDLSSHILLDSYWCFQCKDTAGCRDCLLYAAQSSSWYMVLCCISTQVYSWDQTKGKIHIHRV